MTNFVKYDDPNYNTLGSPEHWDSFVDNSDSLNSLTAKEKMGMGKYLLMLEKEMKMKIGFSSSKCDFWNYTMDGINTTADKVTTLEQNTTSDEVTSIDQNTTTVLSCKKI